MCRSQQLLYCAGQHPASRTSNIPKSVALAHSFGGSNPQSGSPSVLRPRGVPGHNDRRYGHNNLLTSPPGEAKEKEEMTGPHNQPLQSHSPVAKDRAATRPCLSKAPALLSNTTQDHVLNRWIYGRHLIQSVAHILLGSN